MQKAILSEVFTSIQGEGLYIGRRQIFIRFAKCNLKCDYCDTTYSFSSQKNALFETHPLSEDFMNVKNPVSVDFLSEYIKKCIKNTTSIHSISLTGGEPLLQVNFLEEFLPLVKKKKPFHLETNGTLPEALKKILPLISFVSMDLKPIYFYKKSFKLIQKNFLNIASQKPCQVKIVVTKDLKEELFWEAVQVIASCNKTIPLIIQPESKQKPDNKKLFSLQNMAGAKLKNVYIIPQVHRLLGIK